MEISQFQVPITPHYPCEKEPPASTDPRLGRPQNGPDISDKEKISYCCLESTHNSCHPAYSFVTIPITGIWFCIAYTNLFHTEVSQKAAVQGTAVCHVSGIVKKPRKSWAIMLQCNVTTDFNYIRQEPSIITIRNLYEMKMLSPTHHQPNCQVNLCILISYLLHYLAHYWNEFKHYKSTRPVHQSSSNKLLGLVMSQMVSH